MDWHKKRILVTGGASFIGSHLVDALVELNPKKLRVVDNLSSGKFENIEDKVKAGQIEFHRKNLLNPSVTKRVVKDIDIIFHLAADHGGRGYVDLHQVACSTNLILDGLVFKSAYEAGVEKIIFASSGCVYPNYLQTDLSKEIYLKESDVGPPFDADNLYGWAKLMAEFTLQAYAKEKNMQSVSCRYFTVYGPRGVENHAVIAMIAKAFTKQDPFEIWGTGEQIRNWTYVEDIVQGTILAAEKINETMAINLGSTERIRVIDAAKMAIDYVRNKYYPDYFPKIVTRPEMPTGPMNRVADNTLSKKLLGDWQKVSFEEGLKKTIDWYFSNKNITEVKKIIKTSLTEKI